ncbi:MAG TPA: hypothetical protein VK469_22855 [Candidatus Kapabacteria bacterium]|nr:hypothetical protein [Candidatus Kapabacteria bacterium]
MEDKEYNDHPVFDKLSKYAKFYKSLSFSIMRFVTMGTSSFINIDTFAYSSMQGTLESIRNILEKGRLGDAYALLRKYYDAAIINIYVNLYLDENFNYKNFKVEQIQNWLEGKEKLPVIRIIEDYLKKSEKVTAIYKLFQKDKRYSELRKRCNNYIHCNFYYNILRNDNEVFLNRISILNTFSKDLENILIWHLSYLFYIKDIYMMSSDYIDNLELGLTPEPDSQYLVAPFIQEIFDTVIKENRMDLATEIKGNTPMKLS